MAPEIISDNNYSIKSDAYSYSIFLWELFANDNPYSEYDNMQQLLEYIMMQEGRPDLNKLDQNTPHEIHDMIILNYQSNIEIRQDFGEIVELLEDLYQSIKKTIVNQLMKTNCINSFNNQKIMQNSIFQFDPKIEQIFESFQLNDGEQMSQFLNQEENLREIFSILNSTNLDQVLIKLNQQKDTDQLLSNFLSTIILMNKYKSLSKKNKNLKICYNQMILSSKDNFLFSLPQKRTRKKKDEILRDFRCLYPYCDKAYGTNNTLRQHMRNKHREFLYKLDYLKQKYGNQKKDGQKSVEDQEGSFIDDQSDQSIVVSDENDSYRSEDQELDLDEDFFVQLNCFIYKRYFYIYKLFLVEYKKIYQQKKLIL